MAITTIPGASGIDTTSIRGTSGADTIALDGSTTNLYVGAQGSADSINIGNSQSSASNYTIKGGSGTDTLTSNSKTIKLKDSFVNLNKGNDISDLHALSTSTFYGGAGSDNIVFDTLSSSKFNGNKGDDTIAVANSASSSIYGGQGIDTIFLSGTVASSKINGDKEGDAITLLNGAAITSTTINGNDGNDGVTINAITTFTNSSVLGGQGNDTINGANSAVALNLSGEVDNDNITGGSAGDTLAGNAGNDQLTGNGGADTLTGGNGNDTFDGGAGIDNITGGAGNDTATGGTGADQLSGGDNDDQFVYTADADLFTAANTLVDIINGDTGIDSIAINNNGAGTFTIANTDSWATRNSGIESVVAYAASDQVINIQLHKNAWDAGLRSIDYSADTNTAGNNVLSVLEEDRANGYVLIGSAGVDVAQGGAGADSITGGGGADEIDIGSEAGGADQINFETTSALNGIDQVLGLVEGNNGDIINFNFGIGSNLAQADLIGAGTDVQIATSAPSLDENLGLYIVDLNCANSNDTNTAIQATSNNLQAGDVFYSLSSADVANDSNVFLYHTEVFAPNDLRLTNMAVFAGADLNDLTADNFANFVAA